VDWSADGQWIYHDAMGSSGYYDVWQMRPDGSDDSCLTCNQPGLPTKNKGNPAVDPTGRWLVFQAEKQQHAGTSANSQPGMGVWNDLWVMDLQQNQFYQLTNGSAGVVSGSLHPHFSHGGTQLLWSDLQSSSGGEFGDWQLAIATLVTSPTPQLINRVNFNPGPQPTWLEAHGWGPDDSWIYFACDPVAGMSSVNMDICSMSFATPSQVNRLTYTSGINGEDGEWDEHGHLSPDGLVYSYISSTPYGTVSNGGTRNLWLETDLWLMNADGSSPERITYFNEPGHPEYQGGQIVAASDHAWSPDGTQLALDVQIPSTGPNQIWLVTFSVGP
jgi:Tol biopolymer transport system component